MLNIVILLIIVTILVLVLLLANVLLSSNQPNYEKLTAYECGYATIHGQTRIPFNVQYYLVGILFLIFDLEILLLYPLIVILNEVSYYGVWIGLLFLIVLTLGFVYEFGSGALNFTDQRSSIKVTSFSHPYPAER